MPDSQNLSTLLNLLNFPIFCIFECAKITQLCKSGDIFGTAQIDQLAYYTRNSEFAWIAKIAGITETAGSAELDEPAHFAQNTKIARTLDIVQISDTLNIARIAGLHFLSLIIAIMNFSTQRIFDSTPKISCI